jgi:hypothetical protein
MTAIFIYVTNLEWLIKWLETREAQNARPVAFALSFSSTGFRRFL